LAVLRFPEGGLRRGENFWLCVTTASAQCLRLRAFSFITICIHPATENNTRSLYVLLTWHWTIWAVWLHRHKYGGGGQMISAVFAAEVQGYKNRHSVWFWKKLRH